MPSQKTKIGKNTPASVAKRLVKTKNAKKQENIKQNAPKSPLKPIIKTEPIFKEQKVQKAINKAVFISAKERFGRKTNEEEIVDTSNKSRDIKGNRPPKNLAPSEYAQTSYVKTKIIPFGGNSAIKAIDKNKKIWSIPVPKNMPEERVDLALVKLFPEFNRTMVRKYIDAGMVFINKKRIWIAKYLVKAGELLEVNTEQGDLERQNLEVSNILFENDDFLVINKPAGIVVEDSKKNHPILKALKKLDPKYEDQPFYIAHRIDRETSGLLIIAKNEATQQKLVEMFVNKLVQKTYQCLCINTPQKFQGVINTNIGQHTGIRKNGIDAMPSNGGKSALTVYKVNTTLAGGQASIITCQPKTGRSHQIRVHLSSIDCPILGDKIYSNKFKHSQLFQIANRQMMHASQLKFEIWNKEYNFHAPVPADFNQMIKFIKKLPKIQ